MKTSLLLLSSIVSSAATIASIAPAQTAPPALEKAFTKSFTEVTIPGAVSSTVHGINNAGAMTGFYADSQGKTHGLLVLPSGSATTIDDPSAVSTYAFAIDASDRIVGYYASSAFAAGQGGAQYVGFQYHKGRFADVLVPGSTSYTAVYGTNEVGEMVGVFYDAAPHGFYFDGSSYRILDVPGASSTIPVGINRKHQIAIQWVDSSGVGHGALYEGSTFTTLDVPGAASSYGLGLNNQGEVCISYYDSAGVEHPAIFDSKKGVFEELSNPNVAQINLGAINDNREVAGRFCATGDTSCPFAWVVAGTQWQSYKSKL